jgi:hypothetical protein
MKIEQVILNASINVEQSRSSVQYRLDESQLTNKTNIAISSDKKMHYEHRS